MNCCKFHLYAFHALFFFEEMFNFELDQGGLSVYYIVF